MKNKCKILGGLHKVIEYSPKGLGPVPKWSIHLKPKPYPYFLPFNFEPWVFKLRKKPQKIRSNKRFRVFGYDVHIGWPIMVKTIGLGWKDKYKAPRLEWAPAVLIYFFGITVIKTWVPPANYKGDYSDLYWEQLLWLVMYSDGDVEKAKKTWRWVDCKTQESTWDLT